MFEYDEYACAIAKKLDEYDFYKDLKYCYGIKWTGIWDIVSQICLCHNEVEAFIYELDAEELVEYFTTRYNVKFVEVVNYRMVDFLRLKDE